MTVSIRPMKPEESHEVADLVRRTIAPLPYYNSTAKEHEIKKYESASLAQMVCEDPDSVIVATTGSALIGFCISKFDDGLIWLAWLGVQSDFRRQGIAALLLQEVERTVSARGAHKIWADCRTENEAMKCIFPKVGYTQICRVNYHWYKQDFYLWEKVIADEPTPSN